MMAMTRSECPSSPMDGLAKSEAAWLEAADVSISDVSTGDETPRSPGDGEHQQWADKASQGAGAQPTPQAVQGNNADMAEVRAILQEVSAALSNRFEPQKVDIKYQGVREREKFMDSMKMRVEHASSAAAYPATLQVPPGLQPAAPYPMCYPGGAYPGGAISLNSSIPAPTTNADVTTLMIRGIPCSFTQNCLMEIIDNAGLGLAGKYDFFYLPPRKLPDAGDSSKPKGNLGYAFVNFVHPVFASVCKNGMHNVQLDPTRSSKVCTISAADIQGIRNLRKHFRKTLVSKTGHGPIFFKVEGSGVLALTKAHGA